jgi:hypothetical protein
MNHQYSIRFKISVLVSLGASIGQLSAQYNTNEKRAEFYLTISQKYSPAAYEILKSDADQGFAIYANNAETSEELMDHYNTVVHETCHGYNFSIGVKPGWGNEGYFITENIRIAAKQGSYFPSRLLNKMVPKDQQERIFRYDTYVGGEPGNSSTLEGIYGFLNEFSAYYHGTKADMDMRAFYESRCTYADAPCWTEKYLTHVQSTLYAYYEFRLFIAWYLIYAEQNESKVFFDFIHNQNLRVAYTLLDDLYAKLVEDYFLIRNDVVNKLNAAENKIELSEEYIYIVKGNSKSGNGLPDDDIKYLKSLYTSRENTMLEKFRVKGVNLSNYQKFLEESKK